MCTEKLINDYTELLLCNKENIDINKHTINDKTFKGEKFCGFRGFSIKLKSFPTLAI